MNILLVTLFSLIIGWLGTSLIKKDMKKEKICCISLTAIGWVLSVLLIIFPDMPGPTELVNFIYSPLTSMLK